MARIPEEEIINKTYGKIFVQHEVEPKLLPNGRRERMFKYTCVCGNQGVVQMNNLRSGNTRSCGCAKEKMLERVTTHGKSNTKLYNVYRAILNRCYNPNVKSYRDYGKKGVSVCEEWRTSFEAFYSWSIASGYEEGLTIERNNVNGNYCPENCTWIPRGKQSLNKRKFVNNTSGITGVRYCRRYNRWVAYWRINGKIVSKYFQVSKMGNEVAKTKAIEARRTAEIRLGIINNDQ